MVKPILMEEWRKCLSCEHCSDDDEGFCCELEKCAFEGDPEKSGAAESNEAVISGFTGARVSKPIKDENVVIIERNGDCALKHGSCFFIEHEPSRVIVADGIVDCLEWQDGCFKDTIERCIWSLPNGEPRRSWEG